MKNYFSKCTLFLFLSLLQMTVFAQPDMTTGNFSLKWGNVTRFRGGVEKIVNINENNFSVMVTKHNLFTVFFPNHRKMVIKEMMNLMPIDEQKIKLKGNGRRIAPEVVTDVGNDIISISKRTRLFGTRQELFFNKINFLSAQKTEVGEEIINYFKMASPVKKLVGAQTSDDFSKAAEFYNIPVRPGDFQGYGYVLFDEERGLYDKNTIQLPYVNFQFEISDHFIANNGDFYTIGKEFYQTFPNQMWNMNNRFFAKSKIFKVKDGEFNAVEISQPGFTILEVKIATDDENHMVCSGFYGDDAMSGVRGVFMILMNSETQEIISTKKVPFNQEFLSSGVAAWERTWRDRFISQNTRQQGMHNFKMLELRMTAEGDFIGIAEHQEHEVRQKVSTTGSGEDARQTVKLEHYYYFDDLIVYKISKEGELLWVNRIAKNQVAKDGNIRFASVAHGVGDKKLLLVFNDNKWNYENNGQFKYREFPRPMNLSKLWNVMSIVEIDITTGQETRKMMPGRRELNTVLVPEHCRFDYNRNEMYLHGQWGMRRHRFGKISLK